MKKKLINSFILLFLALLTFYTYNFFESPKTVTTFQSYSSPSHKISPILIEDYYNEDNTIRAAAKKDIIEKTLTAIGYEKWKEFIEYIDMLLYQEQVLPNNSQQLIVTLNLSKDLAVVVIFEKIADEYIFHSKISEVVPVDNIRFLSLAPHTHKIMAIYQTLDERFGGFFYEEFLDLFLYSSDDFNSLWKKTIYYEEVYKEVWVDPEAKDTLWNRVTEETIIDFIQDDPMRINTSTTMKKFTASSNQHPDIADFSLINTDSYRRSYYWSPQYYTFVIGEISKDVFLSNAALLKDMEVGREALFGITNQNYKIITSKGEILYLPKNKFGAMFQSLLEK